MKRQCKMESDTESASSFTGCVLSPRLGKCEVCNHTEARYTCPKCEVKTCCIKCINIHKKELNCDGVRDRTKFITLKQMTKMDFMNDYYFLEECTRYVEDRKTDKIKRYTRYNKMLPTHLLKLRNAALERKTTIRFLLPNFARQKANTTYYDRKEDLIYWRIEWIFANANGMKYVDEKCREDKKLYELLDKYLGVGREGEKATGKEDQVPMKQCLEVYQSRGISRLKILLKAEGIKRSSRRFYELDCKQTLRANLAGKIIVEFPVVHICYDIAEEEYDIINSDEDVIGESEKYEEHLNAMYRPKKRTASADPIKTEDEIKKDKDDATVQKRARRRKRKAELDAQPRNFLFSEENASADDESDSSGKDTEKEA